VNKVLPLLIVASVGVFSIADGAPPRGTPAYEAWRNKVIRVDEVRPARRDVPLRSENITDVEVREVQLAARDVVPRAIVNISGVVVGCPCEDGPSCADQVWIVASRPDKTVGLLLSKIDGHWAIGPVQRWWLSYAELQARQAKYKSYAEYLRAEQNLLEVFPVCAAPSPNNALEQNARPAASAR
jgi:hypothetical protein